MKKLFMITFLLVGLMASAQNNCAHIKSQIRTNEQTINSLKQSEANYIQEIRKYDNMRSSADIFANNNKNYAKSNAQIKLKNVRANISNIKMKTQSLYNQLNNCSK